MTRVMVELDFYQKIKRWVKLFEVLRISDRILLVRYSTGLITNARNLEVVTPAKMPQVKKDMG